MHLYISALHSDNWKQQKKVYDRKFLLFFFRFLAKLLYYYKIKVCNEPVNKAQSLSWSQCHAWCFHINVIHLPTTLGRTQQLPMVHKIWRHSTVFLHHTVPFCYLVTSDSSNKQHDDKQLVAVVMCHSYCNPYLQINMERLIRYQAEETIDLWTREMQNIKRLWLIWYTPLFSQ